MKILAQLCEYSKPLTLSNQGSSGGLLNGLEIIVVVLLGSDMFA
jgi:hypothetical protein